MPGVDLTAWLADLAGVCGLDDGFLGGLGHRVVDDDLDLGSRGGNPVTDGGLVHESEEGLPVGLLIEVKRDAEFVRVVIGEEETVFRPRSIGPERRDVP